MGFYLIESQLFRTILESDRFRKLHIPRILGASFVGDVEFGVEGSGYRVEVLWGRWV